MNAFVTRQKTNHVIVGRAAAGIYAILKSKFANADIVVPANICPFAVYPIIYSGNRPVFCDVESPTGNISLNKILGSITPETKAIIAPHMYGSPIADMSSIAAYCKRHEILLIEDCASAMGAGDANAPVGSWGDYVVYSTGNSKIIDVGFGGIVASDNDLSPITEIQIEFPVINEDSRRLAQSFSTEYRRFLNARIPFEQFPNRAFFATDFRAALLYKLDSQDESKLSNFVAANLPKECKRRWSRYEALKTILEEQMPTVQFYNYSSASIPWRFSFFVPKQQRQNIADRILSSHIFVSDWYPCIADFFGSKGNFPNAQTLGESILNVSLEISAEEFMLVCQFIHESIS